MFSDIALPSLYTSALSTVGMMSFGLTAGAALAIHVAHREWVRPFNFFFLVMATLLASFALPYDLLFIARVPWWASIFFVSALVSLTLLPAWYCYLGEKQWDR